MFENLLWKIASIVIVTTLPILIGLGLGLCILFEKSWLMFGYFFQLERKSKTTYTYIALLAILIYSLARAYIIVESFISLRRVPIGVYWTPAWLQMIPHV